MPLSLLLMDPKELEMPLLVAQDHCWGGGSTNSGDFFRSKRTICCGSLKPQLPFSYWIFFYNFLLSFFGIPLPSHNSPKITVPCISLLVIFLLILPGLPLASSALTFLQCPALSEV